MITFRRTIRFYGLIGENAKSTCDPTRAPAKSDVDCTPLLEVNVSYKASNLRGPTNTDLAYKLPGFDDCAQVRRGAVDVSTGHCSLQLKVYHSWFDDVDMFLEKLQKAGWKILSRLSAASTAKK